MVRKSHKLNDIKSEIQICYLSYSLQEPLRPLYQADCVSRLKPFEVFDPDGGEYGDVHFEISSDGNVEIKFIVSIRISYIVICISAGHDKYFELVKESRNSTNFYVKQLLPAGIYNVC